MFAVIGDIHGNLELLQKLVAEIRQQEGDIDIYTVGDMIDRGADSSGVIDFCIKENIHCQLGNHELWFLDLIAVKHFDTFALHKIMGGQATIGSYNVNPLGKPADIAVDLLNNVPHTHKQWLKSLPLYRILNCEGRDYYLIHAGLSIAMAEPWLHAKILPQNILEEISLSKDGREILLWASPPIRNFGGGGDRMFKFPNGTQILGHTPVKTPIIEEHLIAIDTGCSTCEPFQLSAVIIPSRKIITVG